MKKLIFIVLGVLLFASLIVACAGDTTTTSSGTGSDEAVEVVVALFSDGQNLNDFQRQVFDDFANDFPHIQPRFVFVTSDGYGANWNGFLMRIQTMIASGDAPDVVGLGLEGIAFLAMNDLALPMDDFIAANPELTASIQMEGIDQALLDIFKVDGELYGVPWEANSVVTHIRKDIFDAVGIDLPPADWTWDDFRAICEAIINSPDTDAFAFGVPRNFFCLQALLYSNGAAPLNDTWCAAAINSPESVEIFQFLQDAIHVYGFAPEPSDTISDVELIISGRTAMGWWGRWVSNDYSASELYDTIFAQLVPAGRAGNITCAGSASFVVLSSTEVPDEAMTVALWAAGQHFVETFLSIGSLPANQIFGEAILGNDRTISNWEAMYHVYETGQWRRSQDPPEYADLAAIYSKYMAIIYANQMSAQDALDLAAQEIDQMFYESRFRQTPEQLRIIEGLFKN